MTSITERLNELTNDLDKVNSEGILRLFRQCDSQIFSGYLDYQSINDSQLQLEVNSLVDTIVDRLENGYSINVVSTGAGTSGRLAYFISRSFNLLLKEKLLSSSSTTDYSSLIKFNYLIAGGDLCLTVGMEGAEDNIDQALKDIKSQVVQDDQVKEIVVYIGITCGFSAPYVASQLNYLMDLNVSSAASGSAGKQHIIALMGFNPIELARKIKIEKWDYSFNDIVIRLNKLKLEQQQELQEQPQQPQQASKQQLLQNYFILNPIFGPEPLTGSTRMKSGTGTKILLELIFSLVLNKWNPIEFPLLIGSGSSGSASDNMVNHNDTNVRDKLKLILKAYELTCRETYYNIESISKIIDCVGKSLKTKDGHLYYLAPKSLGIVGFIDASETLPTFGARPLDVCGFLMNYNNNINNKESNEEKEEQEEEEEEKFSIEKGWEVMKNRDGDLSHISDQYKISQSDFLNQVLPKSNENDTIVISIGSIKEFIQFKNEIVPMINDNFRNQSIHLIYFNNGHVNNIGLDAVDQLLFKHIHMVHVNLTHSKLLKGLPCFYEISLKWILNSLTTAGFILAGKVYGNRMIDLGLTNNKLYYRSIGIINSIMKLNNEELARNYLLRSLYSIDTSTEIPKEIIDLPVYRHIEFCDESKVKSIVPVALLLASGKFTCPSKVRDEIRKQPIIRVLLDQNVVNKN